MKMENLIAKSISESANIYIWDEPLNYIDILSRIQIEEAILKYMPTLMFKIRQENKSDYNEVYNLILL